MRNFLAIPFAPYNGAFSSRPFNAPSNVIVDNAGRVTRGKALMVTALVKWFTYTLAGSPLGTANPDFNVVVDLNAAAAQTVSQDWTISSVYIDNESVNFPVYVYFPSTQFAVSCPPNSSGWYQVFTFDRRAWVCALGMSDIAIAGQATTSVFFTDAEVNSYLDQEAPTAVKMALASPIVSIGGGGGLLDTITVLDPGRWLNQTTLSITGGGGSGATAHLTLVNYGNVGSVIIDSRGNGFNGPPTVQYTGTFNPPPLWQSNVFYPVGTDVAYFNNYAYRCISQNAGFPPVGNPDKWQFTQIASPSAPVFQASVTPIVGGQSFSNNGLYSADAAGDQVVTFDDLLNASGTFRNNLFGTPYASGFIYITHAQFWASFVATGKSADWQMNDQAGNQIIAAHAPSRTVDYGPALVRELHGNIKLPATSTYKLQLTGGSFPVTLAHNFVYTYSQY